VIKHIVFFKNENSTKIAQLKDMLSKLKGEIEFIVELEVGVDFVRSPRSFDLALTVLLPDATHLDLYANHPKHLPIVEWVKANGFESKAVDYEI
jgi:hypothetical protein